MRPDRRNHEPDPSTPPVRILVVGDNVAEPATRLLTSIQQISCDPEWIQGYEEAAAAIEDERHDVVLLDADLGTRTGLELLRETSRRGHTLPVILLTAVEDANLEIDAIEAGVSETLAASELAPERLQRAIGHAIERARHLRLWTASRPRSEFRQLSEIEGHWELDLERDTVHLSESWMATTGHVSAGCEVEREFWYSLIHPADLDRFERNLQSHLYGLSPTFQCEYRLRHKSGTYRWGLTRGIAVRDSDGRPARMIGTHADVTQRREVVERLLANVSNELRGPLDAIYGFVAGLIDSSAETFDEPARSLLEATRDNTLGLRDIVRDLLEVTRANTGSLHVEPRPFDVVPWVRETVELHKSASSHGSVQFESDMASVEVFADKERVREVIGRLLDNATRFTSHGAPITTSVATSEQEKGMICVSIEDRGDGVARDREPHVFECLYNETSTDERAGLGIGLYLSREIVTRQGGRIWVENRPGEGARFAFTIPAFRDDD